MENSSGFDVNTTVARVRGVLSDPNGTAQAYRETQPTTQRTFMQITLPGAIPRTALPLSAMVSFRTLLVEDSMISAQEHTVRYVDVLDKRMAYVEMGEGKPIVFQHGNPTSSYLWRNIMPHVSDLGRCVALDLIGMGHSDKLEPSGPDRYTFVEHRRYFDAALEALGISADVTLVVHDWGSALGFDWANRHRSAVRGICFMEAIVRPLSWAEWPEAARDIFQAFRSEAGEKMVLEDNVFVERVLPGSILRDLTEEEMAVYRGPFSEPGEDRRPTLTWPRQIPLDGEPADVAEIAQSYAEWLSRSDVPKLFVNADPGAILIGAQREFCRSWPNTREVTVKGSHFIQEDSPHEIGEALRHWMLESLDR